MTTVCAWCAPARAAQGLQPRVIREDDQPPLDRVSHGLYKDCQAELLGEPSARFDRSEAAVRVRALAGVRRA